MLLLAPPESLHSDLFNYLSDADDFSFLDHTELEILCCELADHGIDETNFDDAYCGKFEGWNNEKEFAEEFYAEFTHPDDNPLWRFVDFQMIWDSELRHDFFVVDDVFFFRNI